VTFSRHAAVAGCAILTLFAARPARADDRPGAPADDPPFTIGSRPAWLLLGGVTTGGTLLSDRGAYVGGELSLARLRDASFFGFYADSYYDWGAHGTYVTGGLEIGHKLVGLDGGVALRLLDGDRQLGATGRVVLGLGAVGLYARYAHFWDVMQNDNVIQLGLVLKLPLWTGGN
jgi:hypothetical protein